METKSIKYLNMNIQQTTEQKELCKLINKLEQKTGNTNLLLILKAVHTLSVDNETNEILTFLKQNYSYCME